MAKRVPLDDYPTPVPLAAAIVERLRQLYCTTHFGCAPATVLEPAAGAGVFLDVARAVWPAATYTAVEVQTRHRPAAHRVLRGRFQRLAKLGGLPGLHDVVISNPPFGQAEDFVRHGWACLKPYGLMAYLLRLNFLGGRARLPLWTDLPLWGLIPVVGRPSFVRGAKSTVDNSEYGVFIWHQTADTAQPMPRIFSHMTWKESKR